MTSDAAVAPAPPSIGLITWGTLCRSFATQIGLLATQSYFVKSVGAAHLADLVFFGMLIVLTVFLVQAAVGEKIIAHVYVACVCAMLASFAGILLSDHAALALYGSGTMILVTDVVGALASTVTISALLSPTAFRGVFLKMMTMELIGRVSATGVFWLLGWQQLIPLAVALGLASGLVHLGAFIRLSFGPNATAKPAQPMGPAGSERGQFSAQVVSAVRFIVQNPLLKTALFVMLWTNVTNIIIGIAFLAAVAKYSVGPEGVGVTLSRINLIILVLTLVAQKTFADKISKRWKISTLLLILPIGMLVLSTFGYLSYSLLSIASLMIFFQVANRAVEMPASRQCLVPVPASLRGSIVSLIYLATAASGMLTGAVLSSLHAGSSPAYMLVALILLGFVGLLGLSDLDSDYFQNLWRFIQERISGKTNAWLDWLPSTEGERAPDLARDVRPSLDATDVIETAYRQHARAERSEIGQLVRRHQALIRSSELGIHQRAFDLLWRLNPRWAQRFAPPASDFLAKRQSIDAACSAWKERFGLTYFEVSALRAVLLSWQSDLPWATSQLEAILEHGRADRRALVRSLHKTHGSRDELEALRRVVVGEEPLASWLKSIADARLAERGLIKVALDLLAHRQPQGLQEALSANVAELVTVSVPLLYLEERLLLGDKAIPVSELDLFVAHRGDDPNFRLVADLHLEILKGSKNEAAWRRLMAS